MKTSHAQIRSLIQTTLERQLPGSLPAFEPCVEKHLSECKECQAYARQVTALDAHLNQHLPQALSFGPITHSEMRLAIRRVKKSARRRKMPILITTTSKRLAGAVILIACFFAFLWGLEYLDTSKVFPGGIPFIAPKNQEIGGEQKFISFACKDYQRSLFEPLVKDFQKANPDVKVQIVSIDDILETKAEGNIAVSSSDDFGKVAGAADAFLWTSLIQPDHWGYALNLEPFIEQSLTFPIDDFYPGTLDGFRWQGKLHGLPADVQPLMFFYYKKMFDEAGLPYPQPGWTWNEFTDLALRLTVRQNDGVISRYGFVPENYYSTPIVMAMMEQYGISLWDNAEPVEPRLDTPEAGQILQRYVDLANKYEVMAVLDPNTSSVMDLINAEKAAMWVGFSEQYRHMPGVGMAPFPQAGIAANPISLDGFYASAGTANPEAVWRWMLYLSDHYQPAFSYPARRSLAGLSASLESMDAVTRQAVEYAMDNSSKTDNFIRGPLTAAVANALNQEMSVEEALEVAQERAQLLLEQVSQSQPVSIQPVPVPQATPAGIEKTITFSPYINSEQAAYRALANKFRESHPEIWVEIVSTDPDPLEQGISSDCFAGMIPVQYRGLRQELLDLSPYLEASQHLSRDDFYPALLSTQEDEGKLWGLPYEASALAVYFNKDLFQQAGLALPNADRRMDDFLRTASELSASGLGYGFTTPQGAYNDLMFVLEWSGADMIDENVFPPAPTLDDPSVAQALEYYAALTGLGSLTPGTPSDQRGWPDASISGSYPPGVLEGKVGMWIDFLDAYSYSPALPYPVGVAPLPPRQSGAGARTMDNSAGTDLLVKAFYISAQAAEPDVCWDWLEFLSDQAELVFVLPARRSTAESMVWQSQFSPEILETYRTVLETIPVLPLSPLESHWLVYAYPWLDEAYRATLNGLSAELALAQAQAKASAFLDCLANRNDFFQPESLSACARQVDPQGNWP